MKIYSKINIGFLILCYFCFSQVNYIFLTQIFPTSSNPYKFHNTTSSPAKFKLVLSPKKHIQLNNNLNIPSEYDSTGITIPARNHSFLNSYVAAEPDVLTFIQENFSNRAPPSLS